MPENLGTSVSVFQNWGHFGVFMSNFYHFKHSWNFKIINHVLGDIFTDVSVDLFV